MPMQSHEGESYVLVTEKNRIRRHYYDVVSGRCVDRVAQIYRKKSLNAEAIELFLHIGFVPGDITLFDGIDCLPGGCEILVQGNRWKTSKPFLYSQIVDRHEYETVDETQLAVLGGNLFVEVVSKLFGNEVPVVVPLSGGRDSRAILAALLEVTEATNILTYTFGTPGTLDYEIGASIAQKIGVRHFAFDLTRTEVTDEKLIRIATLTDGNADLFQPVYLLDIFERIGTDHVVWSGYTGDGVGGSHFKEYKCDDLEAALDIFIKSESIGMLDHRRISPKAKACIVTDSIYKDILDIHEEIFFANHVERLTVSSIFPNHLRYAVPFMDDQFIKFIWGVRPEYRRNNRLFNQIWRTRYPQLFSLPLKRDWGLPFRLPKNVGRLLARLDNMIRRIIPTYVSRRTNYVPYQKKLRFDPRFFRLVEGMIHSIVEFDLMDYGIDVSTLLTEHLAGTRDNSRGLTALASLGAIRQAFN